MTVMKTYNVHFYEHIHHIFEVEANSKEEAEKEFNHQLNEGKFDFSDGEVYDSSTEFIEADKDV